MTVTIKVALGSETASALAWINEGTRHNRQSVRVSIRPWEAVVVAFFVGLVGAIAAVGGIVWWYLKVVRGPITQDESQTRKAHDAAVAHAAEIVGREIVFLPLLVLGLVVGGIVGAAWLFGWLVDALRWLQVE